MTSNGRPNQNSTKKSTVCPETSTIWPGNHFRNQLAHHHPILTMQKIISHMVKWHVQDFTNNWWQSRNYRSSLKNQIRAVSLLNLHGCDLHDDWVLQVEKKAPVFPSPVTSHNASTVPLPAHLETVIFKWISKAVSKNKKGGVALKK